MTAIETRAPARGWFAVAAVTVGIFLLVTAEQLPIGLLTSIGSGLRVSPGTAGLMVTVPGIVAAVSAPLIPVLARQMDRRVLLVALMAAMTVANVFTALAPNFEVLLASRVLVGVTIGGFWAIAGGLAVRLVPAPAVPRAMAIIFGGVAAANVLGVPIGTLIGSLTGWRTAFGALGALAVVVLVALLVALPPLVAAVVDSVGLPPVLWLAGCLVLLAAFAVLSTRRNTNLALASLAADAQATTVLSTVPR